MNVLCARRCTLHARVLAGCRRTMPAHAGFMVTFPMRLPAFSAREPKALGPRGPCLQGMALVRPDSWRQGRQKMPEKPAPLLKHDPCQEEREGRARQAALSPKPKSCASGHLARAAPSRFAAGQSRPEQARQQALPLQEALCRLCRIHAPLRFAAPARPEPGPGPKLFHRLLTGIMGCLLIR